MAKQRFVGRKGSTSGDWEASANLWAGSLVSVLPGVCFVEPFAGLTPTSYVPLTATSYPVGRCLISEVDVTISMLTPSTNGVVQSYGIGIYKSMWDFGLPGPGGFVLQQPCAAVDACRDNWKWLEMGSMQLPAATVMTAPVNIRHRFRKKVNVMLGQGEALQLVVMNSSFSSAGVLMYFTTYSRAKIAWEA